MLVTLSVEGWSPHTHSHIGHLVRQAAATDLIEEPPLRTHMLDPETAGLMLQSVATCIAAIALFFQLHDRAVERRGEPAVSADDVISGIEEKLRVELASEERVALLSALTSDQNTGLVNVEGHEIRYRFEASILTIEGSVCAERQK